MAKEDVTKKGPDPHPEAETQWEGDDEHGWAPDAPGTGEAKKRVIEGHKKAFDPDDTQPESKAPEGGFDVKPQPGTESVGESISARGEDMEERDGKDPGRYDTGPKGETQRPTGKSTARAYTGVDPQEPQDEDSPTLQPG